MYLGLNPEDIFSLFHFLFSDSTQPCFCKLFWLMERKFRCACLQEISFIGWFDLFFSLLRLDTNI